MRKRDTCHIPDCPRTAKVNGLCLMHTLAPIRTHVCGERTRA